MSSGALHRWKNERKRSLDNLEAGHAAVTNKSKGRQWFTSEMNHALIVRSAAEFQGFARDLYLESADFVSGSVTDPGLANIMQLQFGTGMLLRTGNAHQDALKKDFARFGFSFWDEISNMYPTKTPVWKVNLKQLNEARNALAHQDDEKLALVVAARPLTLATARTWRSSLGTLASAMDNVVGRQIKLLIGAAPW